MPAERARAGGAVRSRGRASLLGGGALFVWHHPPHASVRRGGAIVLCPAIGYEYMSAYGRGGCWPNGWLRSVLTRCAIDYDGTGNSTGDDDPAGPRHGWRRSVVCAIAEARRLSGSDAVALVGLRAGALLAMQAVPRMACVERLVLWSPFPSGRPTYASSKR